MKILFIWPGSTLGGWGSLYTKSSNESTYVSHGLMSMSAVLKERGHTTSLIDLRALEGWGHFEQILRETPYDLAALGWTSCDHDTARIICSMLKGIYPARPVIAGGLHLTATDTRAFPGVDCVVHGEGEFALALLAEQIERGEPIPSFYKAEPIADLDSLPFEDRTLFDDEPERRNPLLPGLPAPNVTILTTRGCAFRCAFCSPSGKALFGEHLRHRSVKKVIEELKAIEKAKGPIGSIMHHSDVFGNAEWIEEYIPAFSDAFGYIPFWAQLRADFIVKRPDLVQRLSDIGLYWNSLGLESGSDRILKFLHKGTTRAMNIEAARILHENGINIFANMIVGLPTETPEEMEESLTMAREIRPAWWSCNAFCSFPTSELYQYCVEQELFTGEFYARSVFPYQRKIKGLNYEHLDEVHREIRSCTRPVAPIKKKNDFPPVISIVMRSYNRPDMLLEAARSIQAQTFPNWELVIVDDGSYHPGMGETFHALMEPRIKIVQNTVNREGHCILINQGLDACRGDLIAFCDDDDLREKTWLESLVRAFNQHPEIDYTVCKSRDVNERDKENPVRRGFIPETLKQIQKENCIDLGELGLRRRVFDKIGYFDERLRYGDDWEFYSRIYKAGLPGLEIPEVLCVHRIHKGGQLNSRTQKQADLTRSIIETREVHIPYRVALFWPDPSRLQVSQMEVVAGMRDGLMRIPYVEMVCEGATNALPILPSCDAVFVVCPFQCEKADLYALRLYNVPMVALMTEDPAAFNSNLINSVFFDWIATNDRSTVPFYHQRANQGGVPYTPGQVFHSPCLLANPAVIGEPREKIDPPEWDMCIVGYAYPSRIEWLKTVQDQIDWKLLLVGRGWEVFADRFQVKGDQGPNETADIYASSRIIACVHRVLSDDASTTIPFQSACRGYREAYSGAAVMIDNSRQAVPPFDPDEVILFDRKDPKDFISQARWLLNNPRERERMEKKAQRRAVKEFTYPAHLQKVIQLIRSPRFNDDTK